MSNIPFTVYDIFGYLLSGGVIVVTGDVAFGSIEILTSDLSAVPLIAFVMACYLVGHAVSHLAAFALEDLLVVHVLGRPTGILMGDLPRLWCGLLFRGYYRPLPKETQERILSRARERGFSGASEALFYHARGVVTRDEKEQLRLDEFRNLYGFSRNMVLALVVAAAFLVAGRLLNGRPISYWMAFASVVTGVVMLYRYLKFHRQYALRLLTTYAEFEGGRG